MNPRPLPAEGTKLRAVYEMLVEAAAHGADVWPRAITQALAWDIKSVRQAFSQLAANGHVIWIVDRDGLTERKSCAIVASGARTGPVRFTRNTLNQGALEAQILAIFSDAAARGALRPSHDQMAVDLKVSTGSLDQAIRRMRARGEIETFGHPSHYRVRIMATGAETARHPRDLTPDAPQEHFPATTRTDYDKRSHAEIDAMPRIAQDACWWCAVPVNRGDHSRCGAAARVVIVPKAAKAMGVGA